MFTKISWEDYFIVIGLLLSAYYVLIGLRYYSCDLKDLLLGKRKLRFGKRQAKNTQREIFSSEDENDPTADVSVESDSESDRLNVENLVKQLQEVIAEASGRKLVPGEFTRYIQLVFQEYPNIRNSPYRFSINELIISECKKYGIVTLNEEEVEMLWKDSL